MMDEKVTIIILNYNGLHFLKKCLPTIVKQTYKNLEVVIVDNASHDQSLTWLDKESMKWTQKDRTLKIVRNKKNLGFAEGNNCAISHSTGTFLFFLNNDTELLPTTIANLISCWREKSIVSARQIPLNDKKYVGSAGAGIDIFGYPYVDDNPRKTRVFYADGVALLIKKKDFTDLGMFDKELFMFQEDIDLSWRARMYGYSIISCWEGKVYHYGGGTALGGQKKGKKYVSGYLRRYSNEKNVIRNILKNYSAPLHFLILVLLLSIHFFEILGLIILLKPKAAVCYFKAYWWNITHVKNTLTLRKKIQKKRTVSDLEIMRQVYFRYSKLYALTKVGIPDFQ